MAAASIIVGEWGSNRRLAGIVGDQILADFDSWGQRLHASFQDGDLNLADLDSSWQILTAFDTF